MNEMETMNKQYQPTAEPAQAGRIVQPFFQAKLSINQPNDAYEVEADAMADKVMRMEMPSNSLQLKPLPISSVQRKCAHCEEEKKMQRKEMNGSETTADAGLESYVGNLQSGGQALSAEARNFYEPRFGYDFSNVKVHTDSIAAKSAQSINALAYTSGSNIVFNSAQYSPNTDSGKRLLGHELTHVVQQGKGVATKRIQRDLITPSPTVAAPILPDLTPKEIKDAIKFNLDRYNKANTKLIQNILGGPVTGVWTDGNIIAIAETQQQYGMKKDGKVGDETFKFLDKEQKLEKMSKKTEDCLVSFRVVGPDGQNFGRDDATHCHFNNHFRIEAQFSPRCNCSEFEYRQFIRGHWRRERAGVVTDLPIREPGGVLPAAFIEDEDTSAPVPHYGHRGERAEIPPGEPEDHYINSSGADDQANGCRLIVQDTPGFTPFDDCLPGDTYNLLTSFRGEIQRNGVQIQQKFWTAINLPAWRP
jgi:Domain of unknown function (DUF4157)